MGRLTIDQIYSRIATIIGDIPQDSNSMKGAVHTLKSMIVKVPDQNEELSRRLTTTTATNITQPFGETLLQFFTKYSPNDIAVIGLTSTVFRDTMSTKMCETILQSKTTEQL